MLTRRLSISSSRRIRINEPAVLHLQADMVDRNMVRNRTRA